MKLQDSKKSLKGNKEILDVPIEPISVKASDKPQNQSNESEDSTLAKIEQKSSQKTSLEKLTPEQIKKIHDSLPSAKKKFEFTFPFFNNISFINVILSIRHLSIMLRSGLPLADGILVLAEKSHDKSLRSTFSQIYDAIQSGLPLAEAMRKFPKIFSDISIALVEVGEQGGTLEKNLVFLADYLKKKYELDRKIKSAMMYPVIVLGLTMAEMLGVVFFLLPQLEGLFSAFKNVSGFTLIILSGAKFIRDYNVYIIIVLAILLAGFYYFLSTKYGKQFKDYVSLNIPLLKELFKNNTLATFSRTIAILLESGIPINKCMGIASNTTENGIYKKIITQINEDVVNGMTLADSMNKYEKYFPSTFIKMVEIGETTGTLEENMGYLYEFYRDEVDDLSNNISTLIEPILLIFIGLMIGFLAVSIIAPIYQLTGSINE